MFERCISSSERTSSGTSIRRPGGFGARDYRNPAQLRNSRGANRTGNSVSGFSNHQQTWDASNAGISGNMWNGEQQSTAGYDRFQQPHQMANGNGNRPVDQSWWDNTT
jgi:hypothetical protein